MFNLFILDYFGLFSFGFRLHVHLDLSSKSGIRNCSKTCVDKYSEEGQFGIQGIVNQTFFDSITIFHCLL